MTVGQALRSPQFIVLALTFFCCCAAHSGPIFHTVSYAIACGLPPIAAVTIYSVEGLAGLGGRLLFGLAGDRFGVKPVLVAGLLVQALGGRRLLLHAPARRVLRGRRHLRLRLWRRDAALCRDRARVFPDAHHGHGVRRRAMMSSLGMALGPVLGGWIFDAFGSYGWLYIGSFGLGLGAAASRSPSRLLPWSGAPRRNRPDGRRLCSAAP